MYTTGFTAYLTSAIFFSFFFFKLDQMSLLLLIFLIRVSPSFHLFFFPPSEQTDCCFYLFSQLKNGSRKCSVLAISSFSYRCGGKGMSTLRVRENRCHRCRTFISAFYQCNVEHYVLGETCHSILCISQSTSKMTAANFI